MGISNLDDVSDGTSSSGEDSIDTGAENGTGFLRDSALAEGRAAFAMLGAAKVGLARVAVGTLRAATLDITRLEAATLGIARLEAAIVGAAEDCPAPKPFQMTLAKGKDPKPPIPVGIASGAWATALCVGLGTLSIPLRELTGTTGDQVLGSGFIGMVEFFDKAVGT